VSRASSFQKVRVAMMVVAMAAALVVTLVSASSRPAKAGAFPGANGKIAFTRFPNGDTEQIFTMNPDDTNPQNLTQDDVGEAEPAWSPDGKKLAFDDSNNDILVMNAVPGATQKDLTNNPATEYEPTWQPLR
jgi:Tol biopolymer transport system component